jgi:hypothetical protein
MAKPPPQPAERQWTRDDIRIAMRKIERRLSDVDSFDPSKIRTRQDPNIRVLEAAIKETLAEIFGPNSRTFRTYSAAATLDTAGINMNGTPHHEVIAGLVHGKERSITLLKGAIRFFEEKIEDDFPAEHDNRVGPVGPPRMPDPGNMRVHGPIPTAGTAPHAVGVGEAGDIAAFVLNVRATEASFELLMARVALLEAAITAPKPAAESPIGIGHNRGPDLVPNLALDEREIQELVVLLKQQSATAPVDLPKLVEIAEVIGPANNKWRERLDEFTKGVLKGAGEEVGKRLIQAPWLIAVYSQVEAVGNALVLWLSTLPPL